MMENNDPLTELFNQKNFLNIMDLTCNDSQVLASSELKEPHLKYCNNLGLKNISHVVSIYWLRQGTKAPVLFQKMVVHPYLLAVLDKKPCTKELNYSLVRIV